MHSKPPRWLDRLAHKICAPHLREELLGDLHERYALRRERAGIARANRFFVREVLALLRPSIMRRKPSENPAPALFSMEILRSNFRIGRRVLRKNSGYSAIHITGLSIGLWACMMVMTVVIDSLSYDRQWSRSNDIYRILMHNTMGGGLTERSNSSPANLPPELQKMYPEVKAWSSIETSERQFRMHTGDHAGVTTHMLTTDTTIVNILDINLLAGSIRHTDQQRGSLLVTRSYADKMFPKQNPIGKTIYEIPTFSPTARPYEITGIIADLPYNSHLRADVISLKKIVVQPFSNTGIIYSGRNYILLKPGTDMAAFAKKVNAWYAKFMTNSQQQIEFQPMKDIYLHSDFAAGQTVRADAATVYVFAGVALLLLFIACINFVNLSTAKAFARIKEAGVRKILSGSRPQLIVQLLTETLLIFGLSVSIAVFTYFFTLKPIEDFLGHRLVLTFTGNFLMFGVAACAVFIIAILTGIYPAWMISGFKPIHTLKGHLTGFLGQNTLRKTLVIAQFSISVVVLIATMVVWQQLDLMQKKDVGYKKDNLLSIESVSWDGKGDAFKNEVQQIAGVVRSSIALWLPTEGGGYMQREVDDPLHAGRRLRVWYIAGDVDLPETMGLSLVRGRMFSSRFADALNADSLQRLDFAKFENAQMQQNSLMTESAARMLNIKKLNRQTTNAHSVPVGVVADFHNESLYEPMKPTLILAQKSPQYGGMLIRIEPRSAAQVAAGIGKLWKQFFPEKLLRINNVSDQLKKQYEAELKTQQLFLFFSGLTMFLSALGIFGLVVQAAEQRSKEVGIRKVLGASVAGIVRLLSMDFVTMVLIAIVIASPVAWFSLDKWLEHYPYRTSMHWSVFALTGFVTLLVTLATVSVHALRAALVDPVRSLRSE